MKSTNFKKDLKRGHSGESIIAELFPQLKRTDGRKHDLIHDNGDLYEVKTDGTKYTNIFLEVISNDKKGTIGGPGQALLSGTKYFLYMFSRTGEIFLYKVVDLVNYLHGLELARLENEKREVPTRLEYRLKVIPNRGYNTLGYAIKREDLAHLELNLSETVNSNEQYNNPRSITDIRVT